ncbi:minor capsid protein [Enterococcus mundtii]|uniref:minor capsid protein n=1 Tax=Enterococcus TaxID=1350 RepID=UPI0008E72808|nr:minor capsid protein [Enterococcus mundtii]SFL64058.1 Minor capsid protein [Enterococcus mundtii]
MGIKVDLTGVKGKVSPEAMKSGRYALANQAMADMNQFVPKKDSNLRQSAHLNNSGSAIVYETKYAQRQFYLNGKKYTTPGTGPRWDLKAKGAYMNSWKRAFLKGAGIK